MNWKTYVEKKNAKTFVLPEGWDSRDTIAEQLECSPEKVRDHLRPALQSKEVLEQRFNVWDAGLGRCVMVTAYRQASAGPAAVVGKAGSAFDIEAAKAMKRKGASYAVIGKVFGFSGPAVRAKLRRAG